MDTMIAIGAISKIFLAGKAIQVLSEPVDSIAKDIASLNPPVYMRQSECPAISRQSVISEGSQKTTTKTLTQKIRQTRKQTSQCEHS